MVTPADHDVDHEHVLVEAIERALRLALEPPEPVILLGIEPRETDTEYGWILPAGDDPRTTRPVRAFVEKPSARVGARLRHLGALWNTFIIAASPRALFALYRDRDPELLSRCLALGSRPVGAPCAELYRHLEPRDFSRDVLRNGHERLRVLVVPPCGWTDLGTCRRVAEWLAVHPKEAARAAGPLHWLELPRPAGADSRVAADADRATVGACELVQV